MLVVLTRHRQRSLRSKPLHRLPNQENLPSQRNLRRPGEDIKDLGIKGTPLECRILVLTSLRILLSTYALMRAVSSACLALSDAIFAL